MTGQATSSTHARPGPRCCLLAGKRSSRAAVARTWRRPGKSFGHSATTNHQGSDLLYVFSTSTPFAAERGYDKFGAYALLNNGGDHSAAARELAAKGYAAPVTVETENEKTSDAATGRPVIDAGDHNLARVSQKVVDALVTANNPPVLFIFGGLPVRLEPQPGAAPRVRPLSDDVLRHQAARAAEFQITRRGVVFPALPPMAVVRDVLATPNLPFPALHRIVEAPCFGVDGDLHLTPGYLPGSGLFLAMPENLRVPPVPRHPTEEDLRRARCALIDLLADFPFTGPAEMAHAISVLLLPFLRDLISGPTPFFLIEKPTPGTGGSLLAEVLLLPIVGRSVGSLTEGRDEDEWRKRLTAKLVTSPVAVVIDNLKRPLEASALASAITATFWEDRLLGGSEIVRVPVRSVWMGTGNNPRLSNEMARRTVRIRLNAAVERPWLREGFRHADLRGWALAHRGELIHAALVFGQGWIAAGRPRSSARLGMFEEWAAVMGGVLEVAGVPGFLANLDEFYEASDAEGDVWRALIGRWRERFGGQATTAGKLIELVNSSTTDMEPLDLRLGDGNDRSQRTRFGTLIRQKRDQVIAGYRVEAAGTLQGAALWRLVAATS